MFIEKIGTIISQVSGVFDINEVKTNILVNFEWMYRCYSHRIARIESKIISFSCQIWKIKSNFLKKYINQRF